jgi:hypothetical protein
MDAWVGYRLQIIAVDDQFTLGIAGITIVRAFLGN